MHYSCQKLEQGYSWSMLSPVVPNLWPVGCLQPGMAVNAAQHKIVNLLKTLWGFFVIACRNVFNVWPRTTLLPVWSRDVKRLATLASESYEIPGAPQSTIPSLMYIIPDSYNAQSYVPTEDIFLSFGGINNKHKSAIWTNDISIILN